METCIDNMENVLILSLYAFFWSCENMARLSVDDPNPIRAKLAGRGITMAQVAKEARVSASNASHGISIGHLSFRLWMALEAILETNYHGILEMAGKIRIQSGEEALARARELGAE